MEQRYAFRYCVRSSLRASATSEMRQTYGDEFLGQTTVFKCLERFTEGWDPVALAQGALLTWVLSTGIDSTRASSRSNLPIFTEMEPKAACKAAETPLVDAHGSQ